MDRTYLDRSVLVTGASGFIGTRLSLTLVEEGAAVHCVARKDPPTEVPGVEWHLGDLSDPAFTQGLVRKIRPERVFHLASHVTGSREMDQVLPTLSGNLLTTVHILREATDAGCQRVVLAGSMEEPDPGAPPSPPPSPYAAAKSASTGYARMFHALYRTPVALARIFMVYGPGQWDTTKLVPYVISSLLKGEPPALSSGVRPVDWIYVDDVVSGLMDLGAGKGPLAQPVDLGSGTLVTIRSVVEEIESLLGRAGESNFGALADRPFEQVRRADSEASFRALGWRPVVDLRTGLEQTIEWLRVRDRQGEGQVE